MALVSAPAALGAVDGDPIATQVFKFKLSKGFKQQLKENGVRMKPKILKLTKGDVDPTTGAGDVRFGNVTFKKGNKKITFKSLKGSMPGKVSSANNGKLFKLTAPKTVTRNSWGADLTGVKVNLLKAGAKRINKALDLNSLSAASAGSFNLSYQPSTVKIVGGQAQTTGAIVLSPPSVGVKFLAHCVSGLSPDGISPIAPATQPGGPATTLFFPVVGGDISPAGDAGLIEQAGGVRIRNNNGAGTPVGCAARPPGSSEITQVNLNVDVTLRQVTSEVTIVAAPEGVFTGPRGRAVNQVIDPTNTVVTADAGAHTVTLAGSRVLLGEVSAGTLNLVFPNVGGDPANNFAVNDFFGTSMVTLTTR